MDSPKPLPIPKLIKDTIRHFKAPINRINLFLVLIATLFFGFKLFLSPSHLSIISLLQQGECSCYNRAILSTMRRPSRSDALSAKERLRWTQELHDRFEEAVNQLGGPDSKF